MTRLPTRATSSAAFTALSFGATLFVSSTAASPAAGAATATPTTKAARADAKTAGFCAQLRLSQRSIASIASSDAGRFGKVAKEWAKLEGVAPSSIKSHVTAIRTAYEKAATQTGPAATKTLQATAKAAGAVTDYATKNCGTASGAGEDGPGGPGGGDREGRFAELQACLQKKGITMPDIRRGRDGQNGQGGATPPTIDATTQKAMQECGFTGGPGGGRGGAGGALANPDVVACLKKAGITVTVPAQGQRPQLDQTTRDALEKCREQLGIGPGGRRDAQPTTTRKVA